MQIYELTSGKRNLKEYDPDRPPSGTPNYATGVGPGVTPQMTATPSMKTAPQPEPAPQLPAPAAGAVTPVASAPELQVLDAPKQLAGPRSAAAKQIGTNYDPNVVDVVAKPKSPQPALAAPAPITSPATTTAPAPAAPPVTTAQTPADIRQAKQAAAAKIAQDQMAPFSKLPATAPAAATGSDSELAAAGKVKMGAPQGRKANIGGAIANAMQAYNANSVGLGYLLPKDAKNEVYVDSTGKITIDDVPYDANNPEHQRLVGKITIGGKPYNGANPEHRAAYLAFKNTAGRGGRDTVKIDANGKITVLGQPFDPSNPAHVQEYRRFVLGSSVEQTPPPAPAQQPPAAKQPPAAQQPSDVEQALVRLGYSPQQAAALAAKVPPGTDTQAGIKLALANKLNESLTWSHNFDPSRTLLKKIRQL